MVRYLEAFFRNRWRVSLPALLIFSVGAALAFALPRQHEATATIWTESATYLDLPNADNLYLSPAELQARRFNELAQTNTFVGGIVDQLPVAAQATADEKRDLIDMIQKEITIATAGDHTIKIAFAHTSPEIAIAVVQQAIDNYNRVTAESANLQANEAIAFYKERITTYENEVLPRSSKAVTEYLADHPQARRGATGAAQDPQLALLEQQAQTDRDQYNRYQQRLDEVLAQSDAVTKNQAVAFRIIDPPMTEHGGGTLSKKMVLLFAGVGAGLSFGYVVLFLGLATQLDRTLRNAGDVRRTLQLPVLDVVPDYAVSAKRRRSAAPRAEHAPIAATSPQTSI